MTSFVNILVLVLTLLITQTAIAAHDINCLEGEHSQTCDVYLTQDHNAGSHTDQSQLEGVPYGEWSGRFTALISPSTLVSVYFSRAPPYRF